MAHHTENSTPAPTVEDEQPATETFSLQIVSPSVGVSGPLQFSHLPFATTVKELKEKIREQIAARPSNEHQRLIHRGRLLSREGDTMVEIFGAETLSNFPSQTLHLVLRPANPEPSPTTSSNTPHAVPPPQTTGPSIPSPQPAPFFNVGGPPHTHTGQHVPHAPPSVGVAYTGQIPIPNPGQADAWNLIQQLQHNLQQMQQDHQRLQHSLQHNMLTRQLQQQLGALHQQPIPNLNAHAVQPTFGIPGHVQVHGQLPLPGSIRAPSAPPSFPDGPGHQRPSRSPVGSRPNDLGRAQNTPQTGLQGIPQVNTHRPPHVTSWTREGTGPNGERYHVTVNQTTTFLPHDDSQRGRAMPQPQTGDIQNILRMANPALQQGVQPTPMQHLPPPLLNGQNLLGNTILRPASAPNGTFFQGFQTPTQGPATAPPASPEPTVFLLSSPTGPRALVLTDTHTYMTPSHSQTHLQDAARPETNNSMGPSQVRQRLPLHPNHPHHEGPAPQQPQAHAGEAEGVGPAIGAAAHPANPNAGAVAAQMWPHIWLIIRLLGFIWFFTSGNNSWWRWIMVSGLAFIFFLVNTGILNGMAEQVFGPVRRHLETLLPLAGPEPGAAVADNDPALPPAHGLQAQVGGAPGGAPDPTQVARRLLEQRRRQANGNWVWTQLRRAEHAMLLFLASLVPGVGERHIAAREAEANAIAEAERRRTEAANAAAVASTSEASGSNGQSSSQGVRNGQEAAESSSLSQAERIGGTDGDGQEQPPAEQLIEV